MAGPGGSGETLDSARHLAHEAAENEHLDTLARVGFVARAFVYVVVGVLAANVAGLGRPSRDAQQQEATTSGALEAVASTPWGTALLVALVVGLLGYAGWRLAEAAGGHREDDGWKRTFWRVLDVGHALFHLALAATAVRVLLTGSAPNQEQTTDALSARVMAAPGGRWVVGIAGAVVLVVGIVIGVVGLRRYFLDPFKTDRMPSWVLRLVQGLGMVGHVARGVIFVVAGAAVVGAAYQYQPEQARGVDGALRELVSVPMGTAVVGAAAAGLVAFGLYSLAEARYRQT